MKKLVSLLFVTTNLAVAFSAISTIEVDWGFYAHRQINMLATFLLPPELTPFFKQHVHYLKEHAVDPDKRRYAVVAEAPKHYVDVEDYKLDNIEYMPHSLTEAVSRYIRFYDKNMVEEYVVKTIEYDGLALSSGDSLQIVLKKWQVEQLYFYHILPNRLSEHTVLDMKVIFPKDSISMSLGIVDSLSPLGINPYHIPFLCRRLTHAFRQQDAEKVLRLCADLGHYVGDNCVPLHCTSNYNGQLTGQLGIHAFWESRIPELFAEGSFDFFMAKAEYIEDIETFVMEMTKHSHQLVEEVLQAEERARAALSHDELWCYTDRRGVMSRLQCPVYADRFAKEMDGMVEKQMRSAVWSLASLWYTCWINAGKPTLNDNFIPSFGTDSTKIQSTLEEERVHEY